MRRQLQRALTLALGWVLIGIGVVGLFVPVLQGVLTIALGLYVLSRESRAVHRVVERLRLRYAVLDRALTEIGRRFHRGRGGEAAPGAGPQGREGEGPAPTHGEQSEGSGGEA